MNESPKRPSSPSFILSLVIGFVPGLLSRSTTFLVIMFGISGAVIIYGIWWIVFIIKQNTFLKKRLNELQSKLTSTTKNRDGLKAERKRLLKDNASLVSRVNTQGKLIEFVIRARPELLSDLANLQKLEEISDVTGLSNSENN